MPKSRIAARPATAVAVACLTLGAGGATLATSAGATDLARGASAKVSKVTVKVLGRPPAAKTLLARTVTLSSRPVKKDGGSCGGDTVAGALQVATKGSWSGTWDAEYNDYEVTKIAGLYLPFKSKSKANWYWSLSVDGKEATAGVCEVKPSSGQTIVFEPACYGKACPKAPKKAREKPVATEGKR